MKTIMKKQNAFTLIELLIVVAIIAILAAIAVPNFLEAQVRSKVSRAKADMRSMATAIEAYAVDNNKYPLTQGSKLPYLEQRWAQVTTPIAYMTSVPDDVFGDKDVELSTWQIRPAKYRKFEFITIRGGNGEHDIFYNDMIYHGLSSSLDWYIASQGPDKTVGLDIDMVGTPSGRATGFPYDPTNGTVSFGDVIRVGPGGGHVE